MPHVVYKPHPSGNTPEERIRSREKNSGGDRADVTVKSGGDSGWKYHNVHGSANHVQPPNIRGRDIKTNAKG